MTAELTHAQKVALWRQAWIERYMRTPAENMDIFARRFHNPHGVIEWVEETGTVIPLVEPETNAELRQASE